MELLLGATGLPVIFMVLMGVAMLAYVVLDGYDLGVGMLMQQATQKQKDQMIASIGPFWDANETWLVLGVGLLLVAFPAAHGIILTGLYLPVALMLVGLILRGVAFDFRAKAQDAYKQLWDKAFIGGSALATMAQGYMLGLYIVGFETNVANVLFGVLCGLGLAAGYMFMGAAWLIMKTEDALQKLAVQWAKQALWGLALGLALVSAVTPLMSERISAKWFTLPNMLWLLPVPLLTVVLLLVLERVLHRLPQPRDRLSWVPFVGGVGLFGLGFVGLAYSFFPYIVPERMTIWEAASAPEALLIILVGAVAVLPFIVGYTVFAYRVFWGKVQDLRYD
jgi:cytochrome bd ubiquinol oxidase subunit II